MPGAKPKKTTALDDPRLRDLGAPVEVRRHPKARRLTLRVSRTRRAVVITVPRRCNLGEAGSFVFKNRAWVEQCLGEIPVPVPFEDGAVLPIRGVYHRVSFAGQRLPEGPVALRSADGFAFNQTSDVGSLPAPDVKLPELVVGGGREYAERRLRDWLYAQARVDLDCAVQLHARAMMLNPKRLSVRDQSSRWGSCSSTGALSFSWRLIMAPPFVLDYVAAHEVAHLAEMNHGPNFWALVAQAVPRMDAAKTWLQVYGMDLHQYGTRA